MDRNARNMEAPPSKMQVAANSGTPFTVAVVVGAALFTLIAIRSGFAGSVVTHGS